MRFVGSWPVAGRRAVVVLGVAGLLITSSGAVAQQAQTAPAAQQPQADPFQFKLDSPVLMVYQVKPEKAADFETAWATIRGLLAKITDKPEVKALTDALAKMYKVDFGLVGPAPPATNPIVYIFQVDSPSKTLSYNPVRIIYETLHNNGNTGGVMTRPEADELFNKLKDCWTGINAWPLVKIGG